MLKFLNSLEMDYFKGMAWMFMGLSINSLMLKSKSIFILGNKLYKWLILQKNI